jgi:tRNA A-37 threonylcarbamoyl transferase component Bud32
MLTNLRANGLRRSLYLAYLHIASPMLEPLRRLLARLMMLPNRRKLQVLIAVGSVCLLLITLAQWWYLMLLLLLLPLVVFLRCPLYSRLRAALRLHYWRAHRDDLLEVGQKGQVLTVDRLGLSEAGLRALRRELEISPEVVVADIDQDGFLLPRFGPIAGAACTSCEDFVGRKRHMLQIVAVGDKVGVKKQYRQNRIGFLNELEALHRVAGTCNSPVILDVDFANLAITLSYIPGAVIREELARRGAMLRHRDLDIHPDGVGLTPKERNALRVARGKEALSQVVDQGMIDAIFSELKKIHRAGVLVSDLKYGNIIIERDSGEPYFIDFDYSDHCGGPRGPRWQVRQDWEIDLFNVRFDTEKLTRDRMLHRIDEFTGSNSPGREISVDFGHGLAVGRTWDVEHGEGQWHYILKPNLPSFSGKRVLELGCKNGLCLLQMLRQGARECVGIEGDDLWIEQARFIKEGFEWADSATYNLHLVPARIEEVPAIEVGRFGLALALCSLYYLEDDLMDAVIRHVHSVAETFVLQCHTAPENLQPEISRKASVEHNIEALERNGFRIVRVVAPPGYSRPLLIASRA